MGIDGISGGGHPGGIRAPKGLAKTGGEGFSPEGAEAASKADGATAASESAEAAELAKLERGELSLDDYLGQRAELAVKHLESRMNPEQLELIQAELVDQMKNDPAFSRLVQRATGVVPSVSDVEP
ncbi:MAG: hypothetical protein RJA70_388 [Pseudomonadota bacterium]|jgi:hypothetical protein